MSIRKTVRSVVTRIRLFRAGVRHARVAIGRDFVCGKDILFSPKNTVLIGDRVFIGRCAQIASDVEIGDDVMLASFVGLVGGDHEIDGDTVTIKDAGRGTFKTTIIEEGAWLGHGSIVLHGVRVGAHSVVAAGAVVTKDVAPFSVVGGNPARHIRFRRVPGAPTETHS